ncbi:MAG: ATP-binding protein [Fuerstia sp.]|nr:ATP-binding protein [Fuerstiella sp.]
MVELRRQFQRQPRLISEIRGFIRKSCRQVWNESSDKPTISQLELAVSEVASNVMLHGMKGQPEGLIELTLNIENERVCVTFSYPGCAFAPQAVPPPDFAGRAESGYGQFLIQQSVDEVHFSRDDAGHCTICLTKNRTRCA